MDNFAAFIAYVGSGIYIAAIGALCFLLILCFFITIYVLNIRKQVSEINRRLNKLMALIEKKEEEKKIEDKKKLKLDDNDLEKLKSIGVGME